MLWFLLLLPLGAFRAWLRGDSGGQRWWTPLSKVKPGPTAHFLSLSLQGPGRMLAGYLVYRDVRLDGRNGEGGRVTRWRGEWGRQTGWECQGSDLYPTDRHTDTRARAQTHAPLGDGTVEGGAGRGERRETSTKIKMTSLSTAHKKNGNHRDGEGTEKPILIFKCRQAPLTFIRAWYSALPTEFRAAHRYTPPSRIWGPVTFMWLTVVPSDMVYWLVRWLPSRTMGSSSRAQVTVGGGAPLAAHISENCSPGLTTFSLKEETMRGVPSAGREKPPSESPSPGATLPPGHPTRTEALRASCALPRPRAASH